ncbi:hypothetical protein FZEAL_3638 [Fusarium zealandicum]|uniref:Rhodopsin domain-containing protein n=1 Tax=Fusarium zealandicum TaxID=1053134 RepID=A0A8H4UNC5_9HYPO|nr:hypothetical protein FZEAL_3638 [Fusarium zealandicum]
MAVDPNKTSVAPTGLGLALLTLSMFFAALTTVVMALRVWIRTKHGVFAMDDTLMVVGWMLYIILVAMVARGTYIGIGTRDAELNDRIQQDGRMYLWMLQGLYCVALVFIKCSICVTLLRIAVIKAHRIIIWITIAVSIMSTLIVVIGLMAMCRPINANWDANAGGECSPPVVIVSLSYLVSAAAVATDWTCAVLPSFMLYHSQMKRATKISISIILGLGVLASVATIARFPYIKAYASATDLLHNVANIIFWSVFETGTGVVAGSLPAMRTMLKNYVSFDSTHQSSGHMTPYIGSNKGTMSSKVGAASRMHAGVTSNAAANRNWEPLDDASSSHKIYVQVDVEMQSLERTGTSVISHGSLEDVRAQQDAGFGGPPLAARR